MEQHIPRYAQVGGRLLISYRLVDPVRAADESVVLCRDESGRELYLSKKDWLEASQELRAGMQASGLVTSESPARAKVDLFLSLFRGRPDVHAHGYRKRDGGIGYVPACANEWRRGVCPRASGKKIRCASCTARNFLPLDYNALVAHFKGESGRLKDVLGIYVLDADCRCSLLVMDFDGFGWKEAVQAICSVAARLGAQPSVERSRSGDGGHVWFFFEEPVPAKLARDFGSAIITRAMNDSGSVGFAAYDRMFPAQTTIAEGGFGNLIALPFQGRARREGNSVFVDDDFVPFEDQWLYLSRIKRPPLGLLEEVVESPDGRLLCNLASDERGRDAFQPLCSTRPDSTAPLRPQDFGDGETLHILRAGMLYVPKEGLSDRAANQVRRLAAFANPEFYRAQSMHRSVYRIPRIVSFGEERDGCIALPRGCETRLVDLLETARVHYSFQDGRYIGRSLDIVFDGELRPEQSTAAQALLGYDDGILSAPTGFGKTVIGAYLIANVRLPALVIVPSTPLVSQWVEELHAFLDIREKLEPILTPSGKQSKRQRPLIGQLGGGKRRPSGIVDVATFQSLIKKDQKTGERTARSLIENYGLVICDECHHAAAPQLEMVLKSAPARKVYGLSATPKRSDGLDATLSMLCGPVRYVVSPKEQAQRQGVERLLHPRFTHVRLPGLEAGSSYNQVLDELCASSFRNEMIASDVAASLSEGRVPLVLTRRKKHARTLYELIKARGCAARLLIGEGTPAQRRRRLDEALAALDAEPAALVATDSLLGEGFNAVRLDALFLATPVSWEGKLTQEIGRLHRGYAGKRSVIVYDYVDATVPMLARMYKKRLKTYASQSYKVVGDAGPQTPDGSFVSADDFERVFSSDTVAATRSIRIVAPYASVKGCTAIGQVLAEAVARGVCVDCIVAKAPRKTASALLRDAGIAFKVDARVGPLALATFDDAVAWYGDLPILGSPESDGCDVRIVSAQVAHDLAKAVQERQGVETAPWLTANLSPFVLQKS